jgi:dihydropteroate synthase
VASRTAIVGVVNQTADSFSDGGLHLDTGRALERSLELAEQGADVVELGPASSHPDAAPVPAEQEIRRLAPVLDALLERGIAVSVDSWKPETQRYCMERGVRMLNDIQGFPDPDLYPELARSACRLVVMHSIQDRGKATRESRDADRVVAGVYEFFDARVPALEAAGVARERLILDPGMGYFVGRDPDPSLALLDELPRLRATFALPLLVSVSRKSFLGALTGRDGAARAGPSDGPLGRAPGRGSRADRGRSPALLPARPRPVLPRDRLRLSPPA